MSHLYPTQQCLVNCAKVLSLMGLSLALTVLGATPEYQNVVADISCLAWGNDGDSDRPSGGNGGKIDIRTGVSLDIGDGHLGVLNQAATLRSGVYEFSEVDTPSITIEGQVTIRCQRRFSCSDILILSVPGGPPASLSVFAGPPLHWTRASVGGEPRMISQLGLHEASAELANTEPDPDASAQQAPFSGHFRFHTSQHGSIRVDIRANGGSANPDFGEGSGGNGGQVTLVAPKCRVLGLVDVSGGEPGGSGGRVAVNARGLGMRQTEQFPDYSLDINGEGNWFGLGGSVPLDGTPAHPNGGPGSPGGAGGTVTLEIDSSAEQFSYIRVPGGWGGNGGNGADGSSTNACGNGGKGGSGGARGTVTGAGNAARFLSEFLWQQFNPGINIFSLDGGGGSGGNGGSFQGGTRYVRHNPPPGKPGLEWTPAGDEITSTLTAGAAGDAGDSPDPSDGRCWLLAGNCVAGPSRPGIAGTVSYSQINEWYENRDGRFSLTNETRERIVANRGAQGAPGQKLFTEPPTVPEVPKPALSKSVELVALEVTQTIQDWLNSVPLLEGRETLVRAFLQITPYFTPTPFELSGVRIRGFRGGIELPGSPLTPINPEGSVLIDSNVSDRRADLGSSLNFLLPRSWSAGAIDLLLDCGAIDLRPREPAESEGVASNACVRVRFQAAPAMHLKWWLVDADDHRPTLTDSMFQVYHSILPTHPLNEFTGSWGTCHWTWLDRQVYGALSETPNLQRLNNRLQVLRALDLDQGATNAGSGPPRLDVGLVRSPQGSLGVADVSIVERGGDVGSVALPASEFSPAPLAQPERFTAAHEIAHLLGRPHPADATLGTASRNGQLLYSGTCAALEWAYASFGSFPMGAVPPEKGNPGTPVLRPTLCEAFSDPNESVFGLDFSLLAAALQGEQVRCVVSPYDTYDFMSVCRDSAPNPTGWVSKFTYQSLLAALRSRSGVRSLPSGSGSSSPGPFLIVRGEVDLRTGAATWFPMWSLEQEPQLPAGEDYGYSLRLTGRDGALLDERPLLLTTSSESVGPEPATASTFCLVVSDLPSIAALSIVKAGVILATQRRSSGIPQVEILSPAGGEHFDDAPVTWQWRASDPDGDTLLFSVQYSRDGGLTWEALAVDWPDTTYPVDPKLLRGTASGKIRVTASDGFNVGSAASGGSFTVKSHPPTIRLASPADGQVFERGRTVIFTVEAIDLDGGSLPPSQIIWTSSLDGPLGEGTRFARNTDTLSEGLHTVTVTAVGRNGERSIATSMIRVNPEQPPILRAEFSGSDAILTWPGNIAGFRLESAASLVSPVQWKAVTNAPFLLSGRHAIHLSDANGSQFFRLSKP